MHSQIFYTFFSQIDIVHTTEYHITFFRTPIPTISHLSKLGRSLEKFENDLIFKVFFTEACLF